MNEITKKAIKLAALSNFELAAIAGVVVIGADMIWLTHDIVANGWNAWYVVVGTLMAIGMLSTIGVIIKHNRAHSARIRHSLLIVALKHKKRLAKSKLASGRRKK